MKPNRARSGLGSIPSRVVAPITVNRGNVSGMDECSRAFADHHINTEILHGDVQQFLGGTRQTVDLIDKEHLAGVQRTQNRSQITSMLDGGTGSDADWNFQFIGHNHGQSGFAKSRRPRKQNMVRRNIAFSGSIEEKLQLRLEPWLSDKALEDMRTQLLVADRFVADRVRRKPCARDSSFAPVLAAP